MCSATTRAPSRSACIRSCVRGSCHRRPDRAEHLVAGADGDRHPGHGEVGRAVGGGLHAHRLVAAVQVAEDAAVGEHAGVALGHLAAQDRLDPGRVGLVLAAGVGQHARAAVLDGHRRVEQGADRVGEGEQVAGGHTAERLRPGLAHVALGQQ